ncbi:carbohydrate sulfotransferase 14-like [Acanthaster planci]|uniref:Carbohydrate sulfotransferase n=1 Tax=Acanthaster planci TaxID=133434 RepID=A0A8B7ZUT1_ACAPL|nr:carbohydrate sulfotransferase 14-like [Acanthaster planci]
MKSLRVLLLILGVGTAALITYVLQWEWKSATNYSYIHFRNGDENSIRMAVHSGSDSFIRNRYGTESPATDDNTETDQTSSEPTSTRSSEDVIWDEQKRRQQILRESCQGFNSSSPMEYSHMLVSNPHRVLFNFIPKVSCKAWKAILGRLRQLNGTGSASLGKYSSVERESKLASYRKVLFVREPLSRILSAYMSKFRGGALYDHASLQRFWENMYGKDIVHRYRYVPKPSLAGWLNITLTEFLRYVTDLGSGIRMNAFNDHWLPQHIVSHPCQIKYDFIGHFENLSVEGPFVLQWLGIDHLVQFPDYHNSNAADSLVRYYKTVPLELIQKVSDYYWEDYRLFGYSLEETISLFARGVFKNKVQLQT